MNKDKNIVNNEMLSTYNSTNEVKTRPYLKIPTNLLPIDIYSLNNNYNYIEMNITPYLNKELINYERRIDESPSKN